MKFFLGVLATLVVIALAVAGAWLLNPGLFGGATQPGSVFPMSSSAPEQPAANVPHPESKLPRMKLEAQYQGPLVDTIVQRWVDPLDGTVCYVYLPIAVKHEQTPSGLYEYGANSIGSISCFPKK